MVEVDRLPELPDQYEAAAHMFPVSLAEFKERETTDTAYSIPVGSPDDGKSVPLWTSDQMRAYATEAIAAERAEVVRLRTALHCAVELARDAHAHWDADQDAKVGKLLLALAGHNQKYDSRADAVHAALATTTQGEQG
jgi:hypothetical protein